MRIVYTSDLHGSIERYRSLLELAATQSAQAAIVGGDLLPNTVRIAEAIATQRSFITDELRPLLTEFRAAHPTIAVYLLAGNDDWAAAIAALDDLEREHLVYPLHKRVYPLEAGLWLAGYSCVPITPFSIKDYERHDGGDIPIYSFAMAYTSASGEPKKTSLPALLRLPTIGADLAALAKHSDPTCTIYVTHTPPAETRLDKMRTKHVGSQALRDFIQQHQPPLTLHGHIHEAPRLSGHYAECLGTTWSVNPGREADARFSAVVLDTSDIAGTLWHTLYGAVAPVVGPPPPGAA